MMAPLDPILMMDEGSGESYDPENVEFLPDGGMFVTMGGPAEEQAPDLGALPWDANLADAIPEGELSKLGLSIIEAVERDEESRSEWAKTAKDGRDLLGFKNTPRDEPFPGSCGVTYPMLAEGAIRFQSRAIIEMFPEGGPADVKIVGEETDETREQSERVRDFVNYHLTEVDVGYEADFDQMLFPMALDGSAFRKVYDDPIEGHTVSRFVPADDLIVAYGATDINRVRVTHKLRMTANEVRKMQLSGLWSDIELTPVTEEAEPGPTREAADEITGAEPGQDDSSARREIYEVHIDAEIPGDDLWPSQDPQAPPMEKPDGLKLPYVITVDKETQKVLAIKRNWRQGDPLFKREPYFVHYRYLAGDGFYGLGLLHIVGGLARGATSLLRQLVDAGQMANLPAGFKAKGAKPEHNSAMIGFGEWREIDTMGMPVRDAFAPLPFKEPSAVLMQLMQGLIEAGGRLASLTDAEVGDGSTQQAVGTVLALLENATQIQSAIHKRLHRAQKTELRLIVARIAQSIPPEGYPYNVQGGNRAVMAQDFDGRVDVIPVSDPKNFTATQRIAKAQLILQTAMGAPQIHNGKAVYRRFYQLVGVDDADGLMAPAPPKANPADPLTENLAAMQGMPVAVRPDQDHGAHSEAHLAFLGLPNAMQQAWFGPLLRHAVEHEVWSIWAGMQTAVGAQMPPLGKPMPPQIENIFAQFAAPAMAKAVARINAMAPQVSTPADPAMIQAETNAEEVRLRHLIEQAKLALAAQEIGQKAQIEGAKIEQKADEHQDKMELQHTELAVDTRMETSRMAQSARDAAAGRQVTMATKPKPPFGGAQ